ncbi:MAG: tryptophanase [Bacillota bacterium]
MLVKDGAVIPGNMHFDTTRAHMQLRGGKPLDLIIAEGLQPQDRRPFKGNIDLEKLENVLAQHGRGKIPFVLLTITCNNNGGQPASLANIRAAGAIARRHGIPLFFDIARFAENCYFIHAREEGCEQKSIREIAREIFSCGDGCMMSSKKDGLVNMGGFMAFNDRSLFEQACQLSIINEGFPTYGGMAGRDMEALARGLEEVLELPYLQFRVGQVAYLAERLRAAGVPIVEPAGGHAVYIDGRRFLPHIPQEQFPAQVISIALYIEGGIRTLELGSIVFAEKDKETGEYVYPELDLLRLAIPRRVYTNSHMDYVAAHVIDLYQRRHTLKGLKIVYQPPVARHFTCRLEPL